MRLSTSDIWWVDGSTNFNNYELFVALWQSKLLGRWSMRLITCLVDYWNSVFSFTSAVHLCPLQSSWMQLPAWSFENKNCIVLRRPYEMSCTGYRFYRGTTINSVYSSINAYICQRHYILSISVYRSRMTPFRSGFNPPRAATSPAYVQNSSDMVTLASEYQTLRSGINFLSTYRTHPWVSISSPRNLKLCCSSKHTMCD